MLPDDAGITAGVDGVMLICAGLSLSCCARMLLTCAGDAQVRWWWMLPWSEPLHLTRMPHSGSGSGNVRHVKVQKHLLISIPHLINQPTQMQPQ